MLTFSALPQVVCVLKGLVEDGEMLLADGRRLLSPELAEQEAAARSSGGDGVGPAVDGAAIIPIHPNFRLWVLANRPGFPFLGNNFFRECGDIFSTHVSFAPFQQCQLRWGLRTHQT